MFVILKDAKKTVKLEIGQNGLHVSQFVLLLVQKRDVKDLFINRLQMVETHVHHYYKLKSVHPKKIVIALEILFILTAQTRAHTNANTCRQWVHQHHQVVS